jgi:GTP-binding protein
MFLDEAKIWVKAGDGGRGASSFRKEKFVPRGGPDGGDGGRGASVSLVADPEKTTLLDFRYLRHFRGKAGGNGSGQRSHGRSGEDLAIHVPPGTIVRTAEGDAIADLDVPGKQVIVALGGRGGLGNTHFATSTNQAPRIAQKGEPGEERWLTLELRLVADVGIIGYPNAGKSTFLAATTRAAPKIGDYPFTTLSPNLGVAFVGETTLTLADIPGLIDGAHEGIGLGHEFLRHIARTKALVHLIDGSLPAPLAAYHAVNSELALFDPRLADKRQIVAINKIDQPDVSERVPEIRAIFAAIGVEPFFISANTGVGVEEVIERVAALLAEIAETESQVAPSVDEPVILRPLAEEERFTIQREPGGYRVLGRRIERVVAMTDFDNEDGAAHLQRQLKKMGISEALEKAGVHDGDTVRFGKIELEWSA